MTLYLLDVASYQGDLSPADVARAGFGAVNLKISHGLGTKSVHPDLPRWITAARQLGLAISTFHYLDASAPGSEQADYAHQRLWELGLAVGTAHQVDVESDPPPTITAVRSYLARMTGLLGRPVALYTGDWWWAARPSWNVADLTPYLWAAPNAGYLTGYPGDTSSHWAAGYGGWPQLAVMQHAVAPLSFPDGSRDAIKVSKSAIRDPAVWAALTSGRTGVTVAPEAIKDERELWLEHIPSLDPLAVGIVGDDNHQQTGSSYHLGKSALRPDSYTIVESARDKNGLSEDASAIDVGFWLIKVGGKTHTLYTYNAWLVRQCEAGAPDTLDIREVIYTLDGKTVHRWDRLGKRTTGDSSHLSHTHKSYFRDSTKRDKTALTRRYFTEIGLIGDDMPTPAEYAQAVADKLFTDYRNTKSGLYAVMLGSENRVVTALKAQVADSGKSLAAAITALAAKDTVDERALAVELAPGVAAAVLAGLPEDRDDITPAELQVAIVGALQALVAQPPA